MSNETRILTAGASIWVADDRHPHPLLGTIVDYWRNGYWLVREAEHGTMCAYQPNSLHPSPEPTGATQTDELVPLGQRVTMDSGDGSEPFVGLVFRHLPGERWVLLRLCDSLTHQVRGYLVDDVRAALAAS